MREGNMGETSPQRRDRVEIPFMAALERPATAVVSEVPDVVKEAMKIFANAKEKINRSTHREVVRAYRCGCLNCRRDAERELAVRYGRKLSEREVEDMFDRVQNGEPLPEKLVEPAKKAKKSGYTFNIIRFG